MQKTVILEYFNKINQLRSLYNCIRQNKYVQSLFVIEMQNAFELNNKVTHNVTLLQVYSRYKEELSSQNVDQGTVWEQIASEMQNKYFKHCDAIQCCIEINQLKSLYNSLKENNLCSVNIRFYNKMQGAFESFKNSDDFKMFENSYSTLAVQWGRKKCFKLLRVYTKYKSSPNVDKKTVWEKIAFDLRKQGFKDCVAAQCGNEIKHLKSLYLNIKAAGMKDFGEVLFMEMTKAFMSGESIGDLEISYIQQPESVPVNWNKKTSQILLQVYAKYKDELRSPNEDSKTVWEKIAVEVCVRNNKKSLKCDAFLCRSKVYELESLYNKITSGNASSSKDLNIYIYMRMAFESCNILEDSKIKQVPSTSTPPVSNGEHSRSLNPKTESKISFTHEMIGVPKRRVIDPSYLREYLKKLEDETKE